MGIYDNFMVSTAQIHAALILVRSINAFRVATSIDEAKRTLSGHPRGPQTEFPGGSYPLPPPGQLDDFHRDPSKGVGGGSNFGKLSGENAAGSDLCRDASFSDAVNGIGPQKYGKHRIKIQQPRVDSCEKTLSLWHITTGGKLP